MNEQEWQACVNHVAGGEYPVPRGMISNYNDWRRWDALYIGWMR